MVRKCTSSLTCAGTPGSSSQPAGVRRACSAAGTRVAAQEAQPSPPVLCRARGHLGGMAGGALVAALLGPRYELVRAAGLPGVYVVDEPPLPVPESWSTRPRRVL